MGLFTKKLPLLISISFLFALHYEMFSQPSFDSIIYDSSPLEKYELFEITSGVTTDVSNVYDYEKFSLQAVFTSPSGDIDSVDGFYFQDYTMNDQYELTPKGNPHWKIRYCPNETGFWSFYLSCRDTSGIMNSETYDFFCSNSDHKGPVHFSNIYLFFENGEFFFPIGENLAWDGFELGFAGYERWTDSLEAYNANLAKIVMAPWSFGLEWNTSGLGNFSNRQKQAFALDWVFMQCIQKEIYIMLSPSISSELSFQSTSYYDWPENPYNADLGGPCESPWDFFTDQTARELFKRKLRYINSRWGFTPFIIGYELMVEADNFTYYSEHKESIRQWIVDMAEYLKSNFYKNIPVSVSFAIPEHDSLLWQNPGIDFTQLHIYEPEDNDLERVCYTKSRGYLETFEKPLVVGEFGLYHIHDSIIEKDPDGVAFHNSIWSTLMSEAFTCAMTWHWDSYIDSLHLYHHFRPLAEFIENTNISLFGNGSEIIETYSDTNIAVKASPGFLSLQEKAKYDTFLIHRDGSIIPDSKYLSELLYGNGPVGQNLRNPPVFMTNYTNDGQFVFTTAETVISPNIRITVDDVEVFNDVVEPLSEYFIEIEAGEHAVMIENTNNTFGSSVQIAEYAFKNYAPMLRSYGITGSEAVIAWYQNRNYNWKYLYENNSEPPPVSGAIRFNNFSPGQYKVEWWNTSTGGLDSTSFIENMNDYLQLEITDLLWDGAVKIEKQVGYSEKEYPEKVDKLDVYPIPAKSIVNISYCISKPASVSLFIHDIGGRLIARPVDNKLQFGEYNLPFQVNLEPGVYVITLEANYEICTEKIIVN